MTTRADFLGRIRAQVARAPGQFVAAPSPRPPHPREVADTIRRELAERWPATLARFQREFERVGGVLHRVASTREVPALIGTLARERRASSVIAWHPGALGFDPGPGLAAEKLVCHAMPDPVPDEAERRRLRETIATAPLGLTGVDLALAETGTLILRSGPGRPRSTSLLPALACQAEKPRSSCSSQLSRGSHLPATRHIPFALVNLRRLSFFPSL